MVGFIIFPSIEPENRTPMKTIDDRLEQTRRLVRHVDLLTAVLAVATTLFAVALLTILADHWLFKGGLPLFLRLTVGTLCVLGVGVFFYCRILPLFLLPINPVYVAKVLEDDSPTIKNTLVNWILLRRERTEGKVDLRQNPLADRMFDGVTQTAASSLAGIAPDRGVNWRLAKHWSVALCILLAAMFVYGLFSPKSLGTSLARLLLPFNGIAAPQAVRFLNVQPGNLTVQQGERLNVSAEVVGPSREQVYLMFSTDDGQAVRQAIPMTLPEGAVRFETPFPPGKQGFVCGTDYWIQRGDSRSQAFRINVRPVAMLDVESLTYQFPAYTGLKDEIIEHSGDIKAVDGTEVRLVAKSTVPLERANIVFDNDPKQTLALSVSGEDFRKATALWKLESDPKSTQPITLRSYTFRATDKEGFESRRSGIYRIEILPDKPPIVQWSDSEPRLKDGGTIELPLNATFEMPFTAEDPDFGLRFLRFNIESGNKRIRPVDLLESPPTGPTKHIGALRMKYAFSPAQSRLAVGDAAELWIEAVDTKLPNPNTASTQRISVKIIDPQEQQEKQQDEPKQEEQKKDEPKKDEQDQQKDEANDRKEGGNEKGNEQSSDEKKDAGEKEGNEKKENGEQSENKAEKNEGQNDRKENEEKTEKSIDPETNPGDAMEKIVDQMKKEGKMPEEEKAKTDDQQEQKPMEQNEPPQKEEKKEGQEKQETKGDKGNPDSDPSGGDKGGGQGDKPGTPEENSQQSDSGGDGEKEQNKSDGPGNQETDKQGGKDGTAEKADANDRGKDDGKSGDQPSNETEGGGAGGDKKQSDDQLANGKKKDVPINPDDKQPRERDDSLDTNSQQRQDEGGDASNPKKADESSKEKGQQGTEESQQSGDSPGDKKSDKPGKSDNLEGEPTNEQGDPTGEGKSKDGSQQPGDDSLAGTPSPNDNSQGKTEGEGNDKSELRDSNSAPQLPNNQTGGGSQTTIDTTVEEANLKYTEKVTNLVLEYLEDQINEPNPDLLDKLGCSPEQLRQFAEKWKQMSEQGRRAAPDSPDAEAWKEALKSLGLRPGRDREELRRSRMDFKDDGKATETRRSVPPSTIKKRFQEYTESIGKE